MQRRPPNASADGRARTRAGSDQAADDWGDLDEFSARGSEPTLRGLDGQEAAAGFSWESQRYA